MFAAFAERYQIWAAGAHPLVGAAARKRGSEEGRGERYGVEDRRRERREEGRKEVESKGKAFQMLQNTVVISNRRRVGEGTNAKAQYEQSVGPGAFHG